MSRASRRPEWDAFDDGQQLGYVVPAAAAEIDDSLVEELLRREAIAQGAVEGCGQHRGPAGHCQIDQRPRRRSHREAVCRLTIDGWQVQGAMHVVPDALAVDATGYHEMEGRLQPEAVEADQRRGGGLSAAGSWAEASELLADLLVSVERDWRGDASMVDEKGSRAIGRSQSLVG